MGHQTITTSTSGYAAFHHLFDLGLLSQAKRFAEEHAAQGSGSVRGFWLLHLGYVCFLHDADPDNVEHAASAFAESLTSAPDDPWPAFWLAYLHVLFPRGRTFDSIELQRADREPARPYAQLVLGRRALGLNEIEEAQRRFRAVLQATPNFWGGLYGLLRAAHRLGDHATARRSASALLEGNPFVETTQGVMNQYMNGVFTMSLSEPRMREEARRFLDSFGVYEPSEL